VNTWSFTGNLGRDAEQRFTATGKAVVGFSVAVTAGWGERKTTTWVKCSLWGDRGEKVLPYLVKGQLVGVTGEASLREWDRDDGTKGYSMELNVNNVDLLGSRSDGNKEAHEESAPKQQGFRTPPAKPVPDFADDQDIPF
jgi:single-strand DNA-binding protein